MVCDFEFFSIDGVVVVFVFLLDVVLDWVVVCEVDFWELLVERLNGNDGVYVFLWYGLGLGFGVGKFIVEVCLFVD